MKTTKYKVGQIIHYFDDTYIDNPIFSNAIDDFIATIEKVEDDRMFVRVLSVNTKDSKGRWRETIMRQIGKQIEINFSVDRRFIHLTEMSEILYG